MKFKADKSQLKLEVFEVVTSDKDKTDAFFAWHYYENDQSMSGYDLYFEKECICAVWIGPGHPWVCNVQSLQGEESDDPTILMKKIEDLIISKFKGF